MNLCAQSFNHAGGEVIAVVGGAVMDVIFNEIELVGGGIDDGIKMG